MLVRAVTKRKRWPLLVRIADDGDGSVGEGKGSACATGGGTAIRVELSDATPPSGQRAAAPR
jgi:hypothetical protein